MLTVRFLFMAHSILFPASSRGHYNFGWLDTRHVFSFGEYYAPERMGFGLLRVFNDDVVEGGSGFGTHPHRNMEIISIPLEGTIAHKDSMGNIQTLEPGEVQVMSAGSGLTHSEYNASETDPLKFLQIWIIPNQAGVEPRYDQKHIELLTNKITPVVGPKGDGSPLWINQHAWLSLVRLHKGFECTYTSQRDGNGLFVFVISGRLDVRATAAPGNDQQSAASQQLESRDSVGFTDTAHILLRADEEAYAVVIDVPMTQ